MASLFKIHPNGEKEFKDGGARCEAISWESGHAEVVGYKPIIGSSLLVGSVTARTYADQDYWLTTAVTEIIEESPNRIVFKTLNSLYELQT